MTDPTGTITVAQAAQALGVSERTVWRYLKSGRLPGETIGEPGTQRTLIPCEAVDALRGSRGGPTRRPCAPSATASRPSWRRRAPSATRCNGRVSVLQRALSQPLRPGIAERALGRRSPSWPASATPGSPRSAPPTS